MVAKGKTPKGLNWATAGNGSMGHLFGEQFKRAAGVAAAQVPYKGAAPALTDVMGGQVDVAILSVPSVLHAGQGRQAQRGRRDHRPSARPRCPTTPTLRRSRACRAWTRASGSGCSRRRARRRPIVARLNAEVNKVLQTPEVREKMQRAGAIPVGGSVEEFAAFLREDYAQVGPHREGVGRQARIASSPRATHAARRHPRRRPDAHPLRAVLLDVPRGHGRGGDQGGGSRRGRPGPPAGRGAQRLLAVLRHVQPQQALDHARPAHRRGQGGAARAAAPGPTW